MFERRTEHSDRWSSYITGSNQRCYWTRKSAKHTDLENVNGKLAGIPEDGDEANMNWIWEAEPPSQPMLSFKYRLESKVSNLQINLASMVS